jgi:hypothetical protein
MSLSGPAELVPFGRGPVRGDVDPVDAILKTFSLSRDLPDARQHLGVAELVGSEAA